MHISSKALLFAVILFAATSAEFAPNLRLSPDLDALMLRLSSRSDIALPASYYTQPMPTKDVLTFLASVDSASQLSAPESCEVAQVRAFLNGRKHLSWASSRRDVTMRGHFAGSLTLEPAYRDSASVRIRGMITPLLTGNIGDFSYFSGIDIWTDHWTDTMFQSSSYQPFRGVPYNLYGREDSSNTRSSDILRGGVLYDGGWFSLETAIDYLKQGPAVRYPVTFSGYAPPVTYARARLDLGPLKYFHTFGQLKSQRDKPKYFYTHRLQGSLWRDRLVLGFSEVIVNGSTADKAQTDSLRREYYGVDRSWEWAYMIPFVPYKFAEHYLGDRDNGLMSVDADLRFPRDFRWYFEFLLDDISAPWTLFSDDWGNKWAFTAGAQWFGKLLTKDVTATVEYSRVEPWVYTHFYGGSHRYDNFNVCLGNPLGPNSDALAIILDAALTPRNSVTMSFVNERWNHTTRGGKITDVFRDSVDVFNDVIYVAPDRDSERKTFLGPGTEGSTRLTAGWTFTPLGTLNLGANVGYEFADERSGVVGWVLVGFAL